MADRNTKIKSDQIADNTLLPTDLASTNSAVDNYVPSYDLATGKFTWVVAGAGGATTYSISFTDGDLSTAGVLTVTHNLGVTYPLVVIYDNTDEVISPDEVIYVNSNSVNIDLSSFGTLTGTWNIRVVGGVWSQDIIKDDDNDTKIQVEESADEDKIRFDTAGVERVLLDINGLKLESGADVNEFSIDGTFAGNSDDAVPTEKAVKTYIDNAVPNLSTSVDDFTIKYVNNKLKVADRIEYNIMLLAFYRAVDNSKSIYNLLDGFIDEYEDETGIDTGASTNEDYDATNDLYQPLFGGGGLDSNTKLLLHLNNNVTDSSFGVTGGDSPHTVTNNNVTFGTAKWGSHSGVFNGTSAYLSIPDSPDWDIFGSLTGEKCFDMWVKISGAVTRKFLAHYQAGNNYWSFHVSGAGALNIYVEVNGSTKLSDLTTYIIPDNNWHHLAVCRKADKVGIYADGVQVGYGVLSGIAQFAGSLYIGQNGVGAQWYDGYMDEIRFQNSDYFGAVPVIGLTDTITVPTAEYSAPSGGNMTLISNSQIADASPSDTRIVIFEEDVDAITLNTDIKLWGTRENGTGATWVQATLVDEGNYEGNKRVLAGIIDLDVTGMGAGTDMAYKITTHNEKDLKIHGVGINWD